MIYLFIKNCSLRPLYSKTIRKKSSLIQKMFGIKLIIKAIREEQMVSCTLENGFELLLYDHFAITKTY